MSRPADGTRSVEPLDVTDFEAVIERFEEAWRAGTRPEIGAFLSDEPASRHRLLTELIQIDWEYRLKAGDAVSEDEYRAQFPEAFEQAETLSRKLSQVARQFAQRRSGSSPPKSSATSALQAGTVLGNYTIVEPVGQGGMGQVFKATHRTMKRTVALKVIAPKSGWTDESLERFRREVETVARLSHPNIVTAHDADDVGGVRFLVMELVNGIDLSRLVRERGPLPVEVAVNYVVQAARGLEHAHSEGIIHRDIKPGNLIVNQKGVVKVLDLGLARWQTAPAERSHDEHSLTQSGQVVGTVDYMSPEQALHTKHADERSDIYSLGCTLWFLLTGRPVYSGDSAMERLVAHREQPIPDMSRELRDESREQTQELSSSLSSLVSGLSTLFPRMIAKKPEERFQTMTEVIAALESLSPRSTQTSEVHFAPPAISSSATVVTRGTSPTGDVADPLDAASLETAPSAISAEQATEIVSKPVTTEVIGLPHTALRRALLFGLPAGVLLIVLVLVGPQFWRPKDSHPPSVPVGNLGTNVPDPKAKDRPATTDPERAAAEWVLSIGGTVWVEINGELKAIAKKEELPTSRFQVRRVRVEGKAVTDEELQRLSGLTTLDWLQLTDTPRVTRKGMESIASIPNLKQLILDCRHFTDDDIFLLRGSRKLQYLHLGYFTQGTDASVETLVQLPDLKTLVPGDWSLTEQGLKRLLAAPKLESLAFDGSKVTDDGLKLLADDPRWVILFLDFPQTSQAIENLGHLPNLKLLNLSQATIPGRGFDPARFPKLRSLLVTNGRDDRPLTADHVARIARLKQLEGLSLTRLRCDEVPGLNELANLDHLKTLQIEGMPLTDNDLTHLAAIPALEKLNLARTKVTPAGLAKFKASRPDVEVESDMVEPDYEAERDVAEWALSVGGRVRLRANDQLLDLKSSDELPPQPFTVELLDLRGYSKLSDDDLRRVGRLSGLKSLYLDEPFAVTDEGWNALKPAVGGLNEMIYPGRGISARGLSLIGDMPWLRILIAPVTNNEMRLIAALDDLVQLDLPSAVTDAGLKSLGRKTSLVSLGLGNSGITDAGYELLSQFPNLEWVAIGAEGGRLAFQHVAKVPKLRYLEFMA